MWNDYAKNPEKALDWQNRYMNFMFDLEDSSGKIRYGCDFNAGYCKTSVNTKRFLLYVGTHVTKDI
jgi:hypothetical protein